MPSSCPVTSVPAADPASAAAHFAALLALETDCADVHASLRDGGEGFTLLDVRHPDAYADGHVPGAVNLPHARISAASLAGHPEGLLVVYCNGPHCNGADRAAHAIARLGRPVKKMIGGVVGWRAEGFDLATG
jgi:rhodanese-related sulfurtransferase